MCINTKIDVGVGKAATTSNLSKIELRNHKQSLKIELRNHKQSLKIERVLVDKVALEVFPRNHWRKDQIAPSGRKLTS